MSILIKGMEMPTNEPLIVKINPDGSVSKLWRDVFLEYANCKAVPVPKHGGLIVFPCEVDDVLYEVDDPSFGVIVCKVCSVNYSRQRARLADDAEMMDCVSVLVKVIDGHGVGSSYSFSIEDFGKSIFLTREEAEAALAAPTIIEEER